MRSDRDNLMGICEQATVDRESSLMYMIVIPFPNSYASYFKDYILFACMNGRFFHYLFDQNYNIT